MNPQEFIARFGTQKIAVVGDVILDRYIYGRVDRISPEAPIPIVEWQESMLVPGGAGNAAANITALGGQCLLFGVIGNDGEANELRKTLETFAIPTDNLITDNRPTTEKTRILGNHQQVVRIDHENTQPLDDEKTAELCQKLVESLSDCQAILVCDYAKGAINLQVMNTLRRISTEQNIPILADPKPEHKAFYHDLTFITPNRREISGMTHTSVRGLEEAKTHGLALAKELRTNIVVTMSEEGMLLIDHETGTTTHLPTKAQEVSDVSGAGDTVIATLTLALAAGASPVEAATLATHAASVVVAKLGTATVSPEELEETFHV